MSGRRPGIMGLFVLCGLCLCSLGSPTPAVSQVIETLERVEPPQHEGHEGHGATEAHHHLHLPLSEQKCEPSFTYNDGPLGPESWGGLCASGKMQTPIDISDSERLPIDNLKINYQPADLDIINDCNEYRVLVKFPD